MRNLTFSCLSACLAMTSIAAAQDTPQTSIRTQPVKKADVMAAATPVIFTGCVVSQAYFLLQAGDYGASFAVEDSDGTRRGFRFGDPRIWFVPDGPSLSTNSRKARQWEQIITSIERATVAGHPVTFRYMIPGNIVTEIKIEWSDNRCAG